MTEEEFKMRMELLAENDPPDINIKDVFDSLWETHSSWERNQIALHLHARHERPRHFLKWSTIQKTMFVGNAPYVEDEWGRLMQEKIGGWSRWQGKLNTPFFGRPVMSDIEDKYNSNLCGNTIHQAFMLNEFEQRSEILVEQFNSIFEFGGGYGALCYLIHKLGFMGKYQLYDLPEMALIQEYYLSNTIGGGIDVEWENLDTWIDPDTKFKFDNFLYRGWFDVDLFIANTSLSETPEFFRDRVLHVVNANHYYIVYQRRFDGVENRDYFDKHREKTKDVIEWQSWQHPYKPILTFLHGRKKVQT